VAIERVLAFAALAAAVWILGPQLAGAIIMVIVAGGFAAMHAITLVMLPRRLASRAQR
jgi:hypothetical protein